MTLKHNGGPLEKAVVNIDLIFMTARSWVNFSTVSVLLGFWIEHCLRSILI